MAKKVDNAPDENRELIKVRILLPVAGKFLLSYNVGQEVDLPANQAKELVELKYAEFVK